MVATMHPRSRATAGLFGATLAVSFMVVGLPHILPCPVPRTTFADGEMTEDGRRRRRRRAPDQASQSDQTERADSAKGMQMQKTALSEGEQLQQESRECPVPKPGGIIGRVFGFEAKQKTSQATEVRIEERKD